MSRRPSQEDLPKISRRRFLSPLALAPLWPARAPWALASDQPGDLQLTEAKLSALGTLLTPSDAFFIRDHFAAPQVESSNWKLRVAGRVRSPFELSYAELTGQPSRTLTVTLECSGNGVGTGGVSTATWTGVPLATLLERAGLALGAKAVRLVGADKGVDSPGQSSIQFGRSIPVEKALHPDTLLAYQMNSGPLGLKHGFPLRAVVPGWYGMDSVKWLTRIEVLDREDTSYFMTQRYVGTRLQVVGSDQHPVARIQVKSLIVEPRYGASLPPGPTTIRGTAWAGEYGIARVDLSINDGDWTPATLDKDVRPYTWILWSYAWDARTPGRYTIVARATDDHGNTQPGCRDPLRIDGYELNWCQTVRCKVG